MNERDRKKRSELLAPTWPPGDPHAALAKQLVDGPAPVAVYLQAKPGMEPNLKLVLRLLDQLGDVRDFPWHDLRYEHVSAIRRLLLEHGCAPAYARKCLVAVRGVLKVTWKMQKIDRETYERAVDVDPIKGNSPQAGRMLSPAEIERMLRTPSSPTPAEVRDAAIIALAAYGGLRREEISALDHEHLNGSGVDVLGKGQKHRTVYLPEAANFYFTAWRVVRGPAPGPLFYQAERGGRLAPGRRLGPLGVWKVIRRVAKEAGVENVTPHDFRRTYVSSLLDAGVDLATAQALAGHDDPKTTAKYDRRGDERKKAAADALEKMYGKKDDEREN